MDSVTLQTSISEHWICQFRALLTEARGTEETVAYGCTDIRSLLARIRWRNTISILLHSIESSFALFVAPEYWVTLLCASHHRIHPQKWQIPPKSCTCTVSFRCRGLRKECLHKTSDWLYFIHPLHFGLWLPAKEVKKIGEGNQFV